MESLYYFKFCVAMLSCCLKINVLQNIEKKCCSSADSVSIIVEGLKLFDE